MVQRTRLLASLGCSPLTSLLVLCLLSTAQACWAQLGPDDLMFSPLATRLDKAEIQVFDGEEPADGDWSSIFVANMSSGSSLRSCTATLVGPRVVLTAAHCVDAGEGKPLRKLGMFIDNSTLTFTCTADKKYLAGYYDALWPRGSADYALCVLQSEDRPASFDHMTRDRIDLAPISKGDSVLITGFGCTKMLVDLPKGRIDAGPFANKFTVGDEAVDSFASKNNLVTTNSKDAKEPAICKGDSGGPLFTGATTKNPTAPRFIRAVNSKVDASTKELVSSMALLSSSQFRSFLACWKESNPGVRVNVRDESLIPLTCAP